MEVAKMATTSSNGTRKGRSSRDLSKADATKLNASELPKLVVGYRDDKVTPSKAVNAFNRKAVTILDAPGMSQDERVAAIEAAKQAAIADAIASIERAAQRANVLTRVPRGTTGKGGIHWHDVRTELFGSGRRVDAVANNSKALGLG
jgi:hypothetical protein